MNRPPYRSESKNVFGEAVTTTVPAIIDNSPVLVSETREKQMQDIISTSINSMIQYPQVLNATPMNIPGGVTFSFPDPNSYCPPTGISPYIQQPQQINQYDTSQIQYELALKQLEQQMLENMLVQTQLREKPYALRFHHNEGTSTSDLYPLVTQCCCGATTQTEDVEMPYTCCKDCHEACCYAHLESDDDDDMYPRKFPTLALTRKNSPPPENFPVHNLQDQKSSNSSIKMPFGASACPFKRTKANKSKKITFSDVTEEIPIRETDFDEMYLSDETTDMDQ